MSREVIRRGDKGAPLPVEPLRSRDRAGHTQEQAAEVIGVSWRTWQDWERGVNQMPEAMLLLYRHLAGLKRIPFRSRV
jgi:DNA-binding XRE family transcriptional regulator